MQLCCLSTEEMIRLTAPLADRNHRERRELEDIPALASYMPSVEAAHKIVLQAQVDAWLGRPDHFAESLYLRQDWLARCVYFNLEAAIAWAMSRGDTSEAAALVELMDFLYPGHDEGFSGMGRPEAARITTEQEALLAGIPAPMGSLLDVFHQWRSSEDACDVPGHCHDNDEATPAARREWARKLEAFVDLMDSVEQEMPVVRDVADRFHRAAMQAAGRGVLHPARDAHLLRGPATQLYVMPPRLS